MNSFSYTFSIFPTFLFSFPLHSCTFSSPLFRLLSENKGPARKSFEGPAQVKSEGGGGGGTGRPSPSGDCDQPRSKRARKDSHVIKEEKEEEEDAPGEEKVSSRETDRSGEQQLAREIRSIEEEILALEQQNAAIDGVLGELVRQGASLATSESSSSPSALRGRGRGRRGGGRGRGGGSERTLTVVSAEGVPRKRRGRPRGSKNNRGNVVIRILKDEWRAKAKSNAAAADPTGAPKEEEGNAEEQPPAGSSSPSQFGFVTDGRGGWLRRGRGRGRGRTRIGGERPAPASAVPEGKEDAEVKAEEEEDEDEGRLQVQLRRKRGRPRGSTGPRKTMELLPRRRNQAPSMHRGRPKGSGFPLGSVNAFSILSTYLLPFFSNLSSSFLSFLC